MRKPEYDFFDSDGLYKIYNKDDRNHIIAVCENVFDTMIVIKALNHAAVSLPHDCSDALDDALDKLRVELEDSHKAEINALREEHAEEISSAKSESYQEGYEEGKDEAIPSEQIFDPS